MNPAGDPKKRQLTALRQTKRIDPAMNLRTVFVMKTG
jgi:hypothetical protein